MEQTAIETAFNIAGTLLLGGVILYGAVQLAKYIAKNDRHFPTTPEELNPKSPTYALDKAILELRQSKLA